MEHKNHQVKPNLHFWLFKNAIEHHVKSNKCSEETCKIFMILVLHQVTPRLNQGWTKLHLGTPWQHQKLHFKLHPGDPCDGFTSSDEVSPAFCGMKIGTSWGDNFQNTGQCTDIDVEEAFSSDMVSTNYGNNHLTCIYVYIYIHMIFTYTWFIYTKQITTDYEFWL